MHFEGYIKTNKNTSIDQFAKYFSSIVETVTFERRESSFYVSGEYYKLVTRDYVYTIAVMDDIEFSEYDFWISARANEGSIDGSIDRVFELGEKMSSQNIFVCLGNWVVNGNESNWENIYPKSP